MKTVLTVFFMAIGLVALQAQDVKIKKGLVTIDKQEYAKIDKSYGNRILTTMDGEEVATIKAYSYDERNPAHYNTNDPGAYRYPATLKKHFLEVSFLNFDETFETDLTLKKFVGLLYKDEILGMDGVVSEENARKLVKKISQDISSKAPTVILTN